MTCAATTHLPQSASDYAGKLVPAPISAGSSVPDFSGLVIASGIDPQGVPFVSISVLSPNGNLIGAILNPVRFDQFCLALSPFCEAASARDAASDAVSNSADNAAHDFWAGATKQ